MIDKIPVIFVFIGFYFFANAQLDTTKQNTIKLPFAISDEIVKQLKNYRFNEGLGIRIAWNVNSILRFDYAISKEDGQFFFSLGHAF